MSLGPTLREYYRVVLEVDHRQYDRLFTVLVLLLIGTMIVLTPQYREDSQLFPYVIGIPTFLLLLFLLASQLSSRLQRVVSRSTTSGLFDLDEIVSDVDDAAGGGGRLHRSLTAERVSVITISVWTLGLFAIIYLVGFLPGTLLFLVAFYRIQADQSWVRSAVFSIMMWVFIIIIFEIALNTPFYTGVFDVDVPLPF